MGIQFRPTQARPGRAPPDAIRALRLVLDVLGPWALDVKCALELGRLGFPRAWQAGAQSAIIQRS